MHSQAILNTQKYFFLNRLIVLIKDVHASSRNSLIMYIGIASLTAVGINPIYCKTLILNLHILRARNNFLEIIF